MSSKMIYLQPIPVRIWHWLNALGIVTLCISGAQIRFPEYVTLLGSYRSAIMLHNTAGIVVALSFSIWFFYYKLVADSIDDIYIPKGERSDNRTIPAGNFLFLCLFLWSTQPAPCHTGKQVQSSSEISLSGHHVCAYAVCQPDRYPAYEYGTDARNSPYGRWAQDPCCHTLPDWLAPSAPLYLPMFTWQPWVQHHWPISNRCGPVGKRLNIMSTEHSH